MKFEFNVGTVDRIVRMLIGLVLVFAGLKYNYWLMGLGFIIMLTGAFSFCWLYTLLGINTKKKSASSHG